MSKYTLVIVDISGIQNYIFGSNRLKENIGASELVYQATGPWPRKILSQWKTNVRDVEARDVDSLSIEKDNLDAELVYSGGGNCAVLFRDERAKEFTEHLSRRVLQEAPGLDLVVVHHTFDWQAQSLTSAMDAAMKKLFEKKNNRSASLPLLGLSVTAFCESSGLAAVAIDEKKKGDGRNRLISAEIKSKLEAADKASKRLGRLFPGLEAKNLEIPMELDDLGRTRDKASFIGIVHADGNALGSRLRKISDSFNEPSKNRDYVTALRAFSTSVEQASQESLNKMVNVLLESIDKGVIKGQFELGPANGGRHFFPLRPIVFGGDDLTFVCDGRLALSLAQAYLSAFEAHLVNEPLFACAGVAIVKSHYPFTRGYLLSEELCSSAKKHIRETMRKEDGSASALDWHVAMSGIAGSPDEIRKREYKVAAGDMTMKPVQLRKENTDTGWRSWENLRAVIDAFQNHDEWKEKRNKVKALREALRGGPEEVQHFRKLYLQKDREKDKEKELPGFPGIDHQDLRKKGWKGGICGYFDAIEMMDLFVDLTDGRAK